jgi:hypothetical protein
VLQRVDGAFQIAAIDDSFDHYSWRIAVIQDPPVADAQSVPARMAGERFDIEVEVFAFERPQTVNNRLPVVQGNSPKVPLTAPRNSDRTNQGYFPASSPLSTSSRGRPRVPRAISRSAVRIERTYSGALASA